MPINQDKDPRLTIVRYKWRSLPWFRKWQIYLIARWAMFKRRLNGCQ